MFYLRFLGLLIVIFGLAPVAFTQGTFKPRSGAEAQAWRVYQEYRESIANEARLIRGIEAQKGDVSMVSYGYESFMAQDATDVSLLNQMRHELAIEKLRQENLLALWKKFFYFRYGDLKDSDKPATEGNAPQMDKIQFALINFRYYRESGAQPTGATYTAQKGGADKWSDVRVTLTNVADFKTKDAPGWRNNGTTFTANTSGNARVGIKVEIVAKGGVSYYDYSVDVTVTTADKRLLLNETTTISKDGGMKTFSAEWDPASAPGGITVHAGIGGGNPEGFIYYVDGIVGRSPGGVTKSSSQPSASATPTQLAQPAATRTKGLVPSYPIDLTAVGGKKGAPRKAKNIDIDDSSWIRLKDTDEKRQTINIQLPSAVRASQVAIVTNLDDATYLDQGVTIARMIVVTNSGNQIFEIKAGVHSSEWNYAVQPKHSRVDALDIGDNRFLATFAMGQPFEITGIRFEYVETNAPRWFEHAPGFVLRGITLLSPTG